MKWINATGLLLQFFAFWFAAPELLGVNTLKRLESGLKKFLSLLPGILFLTLAAVFGLGFSIIGLIKGLRASSEGIEKQEVVRYFIILGSSFLVYLVFVLRYSRIRAWIENHLSGPLIDRILHSQNLRQNALKLGALLFSIGFVLQFMAILTG